MSRAKTRTAAASNGKPASQSAADKIAKELLASTDLVREVELETLKEVDHALWEEVTAKMATIKADPASPKKIIQTKEDVDKLLPHERNAVNEFVKQHGGTIPQGGLFQVKLNGISGLTTAIDTLVTNGTPNLATVVCSRLAADRASRIVQSLQILLDYATMLQHKKQQAAADKEMIKRIDHAIKVTFGENDYNAAIELCKEILLGQNKKGKRKS